MGSASNFAAGSNNNNSGRRLPLLARFRSSLLKGAGALLGAWLIGAWLLGAQQANKNDMPLETGPVVLAMQKIGNLHAANFAMKDVVVQETHAEPEGVLSHVPGADSVVHWATHNQALVVADGSVEAGVDLTHLAAKDVTQVQEASGKKTLRVHLPAVIVYPPNVHVRVAHNDAGLFWRDENIVPKAQERAARQFLAAAEEKGIRRQAQEQAIAMLNGMQRLFGQDVEFYF